MILINRCVVVLGLLVGAFASTAASAAVITYDFFVTPSVGSLSGQTFSGSFSFDDSALTGIGREDITPGNADLDITFWFAETEYWESDDFGFELENAEWPRVAFEDGVLLGMSFWVLLYEPFQLGSEASGWADVGFDFGYDEGISLNAVSYRLVTQQVPEPMPLALVGVGLAGLGLIRRHKSCARRNRH